MNVLGIDPGQKGGLAVVGSTVAAIPMPLKGKDIDGQEAALWIAWRRPKLAVVERVHAMRGQGVSSSFKFGQNYGTVLGVIEALAIPYMLVTPQRWKKTILADTDKSKEAAIAYCRRLYPDVDLVPPGCRVAHDGMADALCLATYGTL